MDGIYNVLFIFCDTKREKQDETKQRDEEKKKLTTKQLELELFSKDLFYFIFASVLESKPE
jgi:hypothetical protein